MTSQVIEMQTARRGKVVVVGFSPAPYRITSVAGSGYSLAEAMEHCLRYTDLTPADFPLMPDAWD